MPGAGGVRMSAVAAVLLPMVRLKLRTCAPEELARELAAELWGAIDAPADRAALQRVFLQLAADLEAPPC